MDFLEGDRARLEPSGPSNALPPLRSGMSPARGISGPPAAGSARVSSCPSGGSLTGRASIGWCRECIPPPKRWLWISAAK